MSTTEIIATCAAVISCGLLLIHYFNQRERRHGELIQLKLQILAVRNAQRQRIAALLIQAETVRLELRRLPENDPQKHTHIEGFSAIIERHQEVLAKMDETITKMEKFDTKTHNTSSGLIELQLIAGDVQQLEALVRKGEDKMIGLLQSTHAGQKIG